MKLEKKNISYYPGIIFNKKDILYFTGAYDFEDAILLLFPDHNQLYVAAFEVERAKNEVNKHTKVLPFPSSFKLLYSELKNEIKKNSGKKQIFIDKTDLNVSNFNKLRKIFSTYRFIDFHNFIVEKREIKSSKEISTIKKACSITKNILKNIEFTGTEIGLAALIEYKMKREGASIAFNTVVASGKHSRFPHARPRDKTLEQHVLIDCGARLNGYCADITRTFPHTSSQGKSVELVQHAQAEAIDIIEVGVSFKEIDDTVRKALGNQVKYFSHSTGHGVGLNIHEKPSVSPHSKEVVKEGHVFTIEPGLYLSQYGVRWEDTVAVTPKGVKVL